MPRYRVQVGERVQVVLYVIADTIEDAEDIVSDAIETHGLEGIGGEVIEREFVDMEIEQDDSKGKGE